MHQLTTSWYVDHFLNILVEALLQLAIVLPVLFVAAKKLFAKPNRKWLIFFAALFAGIQVITGVLNIAVVAGQTYNWIGKGAALLVLMICVSKIPVPEYKTYNLTGKFDRSKSRILIIIAAIYLAVRIYLYAVSKDASGLVHWKTILFEGGLVPIEEELLFRSLLFGLLIKLFGKAELWLVLITSLLFGLVHGLSLNGAEIHINWFELGRTAFEGMLFALIARKNENLVPAIVYHALLNLVGNH
jgi:membrane protease YdiL (CAAX protease family)